MTPWKHDHAFGQDEKKPGEFRTLVVVLLTAITMVVEITAGVAFNSMALLADGLHMAAHATALAIAMFAYVYARRFAHDKNFSFGTGKVNSLAGFAGAILLASFSAIMAWESVHRLIDPMEIAFDHALVVAVVGLIVNGLSVFILGHAGIENHEHDQSEHAEHGHHHDHDHNLRSAYLHVLADTLTSLLAIAALLAGLFNPGLSWLDPVMGVVGSILVARWSLGLLRTTSNVLIDKQGPEGVLAEVRKHVEQQGDDVTDLHYWAVAPGKFAMILGVLTDDPNAMARYRETIPEVAHVVHLTVEVWPRDPT